MCRGCVSFFVNMSLYLSLMCHTVPFSGDKRAVLSEREAQDHAQRWTNSLSLTDIFQFHPDHFTIIQVSVLLLQMWSLPTSWWTHVERSSCVTLVLAGSLSTPWPTHLWAQGPTCLWVCLSCPLCQSNAPVATESNLYYFHTLTSC